MPPVASWLHVFVSSTVLVSIGGGGAASPSLGPAHLDGVRIRLVQKHGEAQRERIERGIAQVAARWRPADGPPDAFEGFVEAHFLSDEAALLDTLAHLEYALEMLDGHANEVQRELGRFQTLDEGPPRPVDTLLAAYSPTAHFSDDLFGSRVAFVALLNFPLTTLDERLGRGASWSRAEWATARLTERFRYRVPAELEQEVARVDAAAAAYVAAYDVQDLARPGSLRRRHQHREHQADRGLHSGTSRPGAGGFGRPTTVTLSPAPRGCPSIAACRSPRRSREPSSGSAR